MPEFELLCDNLFLTAGLEDTAQLKRLKTWCHKEISRDLTCSGSPKEQYQYYISTAKRYYNVFIAKKFTHMNDIQYAALQGYEHFIATLDESPEAFDLPDKDGMTPLHWAAFKGHVHTVKALLDKGANPEKLNANSQMPIYSALLVPMKHDAQLLPHKRTVFKTLLKKSPKSVEHQDKGGDSVFHLMAGDDHFSSLLKDSLKTNLASLDRPNNLKHYPIHTAILNNKINNARILLASDTGVDIQADRDSRVALHYAAMYGTKDMLHLCLANSTTDINIRDTYNKTPLILAAESGNQEAISTLLLNNANPDLVDCDQKNYLQNMKGDFQNTM